MMEHNIHLVNLSKTGHRKIMGPRGTHYYKLPSKCSQIGAALSLPPGSFLLQWKWLTQKLELVLVLQQGTVKSQPSVEFLYHPLQGLGNIVEREQKG